MTEKKEKKEQQEQREQQQSGEIGIQMDLLVDLKLELKKLEHIAAKIKCNKNREKWNMKRKSSPTRKKTPTLKEKADSVEK